MKNLHKIKSQYDVPDWVKAWVWWAQTSWKTEAYEATNIVYSKKGMSCMIEGFEETRTSPLDLVNKEWVRAGRPQPDLTRAIYAKLT